MDAGPTVCMQPRHATHCPPCRGALSWYLLGLFPGITPRGLECHHERPRTIASCAQGLEIPLLGLVGPSCLSGPRDQGGEFPSCPKGTQAPSESGACDRSSGLSRHGHLAKGLGFRNSPGLRGAAASGPKVPMSTIWMGSWGTQ